MSFICCRYRPYSSYKVTQNVFLFSPSDAFEWCKDITFFRLFRILNGVWNEFLKERIILGEAYFNDLWSFWQQPNELAKIFSPYGILQVCNNLDQSLKFKANASLTRYVYLRRENVAVLNKGQSTARRHAFFRHSRSMSPSIESPRFLWQVRFPTKNEN